MRGIIRKIDSQRRLIIPREMLNAIGVEPGDLLQIVAEVDGNGETVVILQKWQAACAGCGLAWEEDFMFSFPNGNRICRECIESAMMLLE